MSDDDDAVPLSFSSFDFTGSIPQFFTRSRHKTSLTFLTETPTDFPASTPVLSTPSDVNSLLTLTRTDDPTAMDASPSSTGTLNTPTPTPGNSDSLLPTSTDLPLSVTLLTELSSSSGSPSDSSITIDPSTPGLLPDISTPTTIFTFTSTLSDDPPSTFSSIPSDSSLTTDSNPTLTTSSLPLTTPPPTSTPVPTSSPTPSQLTSSTFPLPQLPSSRSSSPSSVTTTSFPSFSVGSPPPQSRTSTTSTGMIIAATTGAIALAIILALLAILCRKRHSKRVRRRATQDPFLGLDLDTELVAVNQPLIIGDGPGPGGAVYTDPFTDDSRPRTQSRSLSATTGPPPSLARSNYSFQAVAGTMPTHDPRAGLATEYYNQHQSIDRPSPPPTSLRSNVARSPSHQSLPQVQTQFPSEPPIPRQSSPSFDAGAIAYLRNNDQTTDPGPYSPGQLSPGNGEDHRLISAFGVTSGLSPQYASPIAPPNIDEMWRNSPDPINTSSSYRPLIDRRQSFTPSVSGHICEPFDASGIVPIDLQTQVFVSPLTSPGSDIFKPYTSLSGNFGSRPSPITEVSELPTHSQEGSNNSGGTWISTRSVDSSGSSPVVMKAHRVRLTPTALSIVSPQTPSTDSNYGGSIPSLGSTTQLPQPSPIQLPPLPQVQPLSLGKKRSVQGTP